jgi:hypothetical protein
MTRKIINSILSKKMNDWIDSITDLEVQQKIRENVIVTGGCIVSLLGNEKPKDYDVYFKNKDTIKSVANYYIKKFNDSHGKENIYIIDGEQIEEAKNKWIELHKKPDTPMGDNPRIPQNDIEEINKEYEKLIKKYEFEKLMFNTNLTKIDKDRIRIMIRSKGIAGEEDILEEDTDDIFNSIEKADSIPEDILEKLNEEKIEKKEKYRPIFFSSNAITLSDNIQIIVRFYGEPEEIHKNYDFVHCTNYWTFKDKLILQERALEAIITKQLIYVGSKYPLCSVIRTRKFIKRGWNINAGQYLKMLFQVGELDLKDPWVLEDQLIGVDSAYFNSLIHSLQEQIMRDPNLNITSGYLSSIIDKIF